MENSFILTLAPVLQTLLGMITTCCDFVVLCISLSAMTKKDKNKFMWKLAMS